MQNKNNIKYSNNTFLQRDVRKEVLKNILITKSTLENVIQRTHDAKEDVRVAAFERIAENVNVKKLSISQRVSLLRTGFSDRAISVQKACLSLLIDKWLNQMDSNVIKLLSCFDVENYMETSEIVLSTIFQQCIKNEKNLHEEPFLPIKNHVEILSMAVDFKELTPESVLYLRTKCDFFQKEKVEFLQYQINIFIFFFSLMNDWMTSYPMEGNIAST